jgi:hypothetical protein
MKCKHCGLAIRSQNMGPVVASYIHLASVNQKEMVSCAFATIERGFPSHETYTEYPAATCRAEPEIIDDIEVPDEFFAPVSNPTFTRVPETKAPPSTVVRELPPVTGRKFR